MKAWIDRPVELANLFNPAFCAVLLRETASGFSSASEHPIDFALIFLAMPLVLHTPTRVRLPGTVATKHHPWLEVNQDLRIGFSERVANLAPFVREGLLFGCNTRLLDIDTLGRVSAPRRRSPRRPWPAVGEVAECVRAAKFVGRWLAGAGDSATLFVLWGLKP